MNNKQNNYLSSYLAVKVILERYTDVIASIPAMVKLVSAFNDNLQSINSFRQIQDGYSIGVALQKQKEKEDMLTIVLQLSAGVYVYALAAKNLTLQQQVKVSYAGLKKLSDTKLLNRCEIIYKTITGIDINELVDYGINAELVVKLRAEIDDFKGLLAAPRSAIVTRSTSTAKLKELFAATNMLLREQLDKMMLLFKADHLAFYNEYMSARIIIDLHGPVVKRKVTVTEG